MSAISALQAARAAYQPKLPTVFANGAAVNVMLAPGPPSTVEIYLDGSTHPRNSKSTQTECHSFVLEKPVVRSRWPGRSTSCHHSSLIYLFVCLHGPYRKVTPL